MSYTDEEVELLFNEKPFHFGTAGVRRTVGISPQQWNKYTYRLLAVGYAGYIKEKSSNVQVLVAHDNRPNGTKYALEIAKTLKYQGLTVYLVPKNESIATPIVSYWVKKLSLAGAINVTASHNPIEYNGFKSYNSSGCQTNDDEEKNIIKHTPKYSEIFEIKTDESSNFLFLPDNYVEDYFSDLIERMPDIEIKNKNIKFLFSSHHGTSSKIMKQLAYRMGFYSFVEFEPECTTVFKLNEREILNPEDKKSFCDSMDFADKHEINYLMAHDPDSDRNSIVEKQHDNTWYLFNGNEMAILLVDFLLQHDLKKDNRYIVTTYVSGNFINKICPQNTKIFITKTGFKNISPVIDREGINNNLLIGFEEAIGALVFDINREKDGFQTTSLFLQMVCKYHEENKNLYQRLQDIYQKHGFWVGITHYFESKEIYWKELFNQKMQIILKHSVQNIFGYEIEKIHFNIDADAVEWLMKNDNWIKFRQSGTEPKFKIYYNLYGNNREKILETISRFQEYFKDLLGF